MTDRNVFRIVVCYTSRGRLSETRGLSEGAVITELPDDYEVDNVKAIEGVNASSNDSNDNIDTNTDVAVNALANDDNALNTNARAKPEENKQSGRAYTDLVDFEETGEKTGDKCKPKHEDDDVHCNLGLEVTTNEMPSRHPSNFIRSNDRDFTNDPTKHDTKELEVESPTAHESDFNDSSKPLGSANRNGTHLSNAYHPDGIHNTDSSQLATAVPKQNAWNATFGNNDHKNRTERARVEPFVLSGASKPVTAKDAHRIEAVTSQHGHSNQDTNDEHIAICPTCAEQKYCKHKEIKEMHKQCCHGCYHLLIRCTSCKKTFSEEELLTLTEKRSAKLNKNAIPRKSKCSFVEAKERPKTPYTKEKDPSTNSLDPQCLFDDLVASVGLTVRNVSADGNCMFTAMVDQLRIHGNFTYTPRMLRAAVVGFLRQNPQLDNDTHLQEFVEEPWEKYLDHMSQDGHWGDHVVIRGLANLLNTKIRIYREFYDGLNTTDTLPDNVKERSSRPDKDVTQYRSVETDEDHSVINLGHVYDMHYVSLRPQKWKETLFKENDREGRDSTCPAGIANGFEVPTEHMSFAIKYCVRQQYTLPPFHVSTKRIEGQMHEGNIVHNEHHDALYTYTYVQQNSSDNNNFVAFVSPTDTLVIRPSTPITTEYRYYLEHVINTNVTVWLRPTEPTIWKRCINDENYLRIIYPLSISDDQRKCCMAFFCDMPEHMSSQWLTRKRPHSWPSDTVVKDVLHKGFRLIPAPSVSSYDWQYDFRCAENIIVENAMNKDQKECFKLTQLILNEVMVNESLPYAALKHAFFFHCERTAEDEWKHNPAACVLSFIDRLLRFNSTRKDFFPNFFEGANGPTYYGFKIEDQHVLQNRLLAARQHPYECLYFAVCSLNPSRSLGQMFNSIIENILTNNGINAYSQCFLPTTRDEIVDLVVASEYSAAHVLCCETPEDLNCICGSQLTSTYLLQQVIYYVVDPIKQWVFALQADFKTKQHFLETVLVDQDIVPISGIYGRMVDDILSSETGQQVMIPGHIIEPKKFFLTTRELVKFMKQQQVESSVICSAVTTGIMYISPRLQEMLLGSTDKTAVLDAKEAVIWDMDLLMKDVDDVIKEQHTRRVNDLSYLQKIMNLMSQSKRSGSGQTRKNRRENVEALLQNVISIMSSTSQGGAELPMHSE